MLEPATISAWLKELHGKGREGLVQIHEPVNRFPDFVRYLVQRFKVLCPTLGKVKIAQILGRAGLHIAPSTVRRIIRAKPVRPPEPTAPKHPKPEKIVTARYPDHVHHVDLTVIPTAIGMALSLPPFSLPQFWPFCWWALLVEDHFSRRIQGFTLFMSHPTSVQVRTFLGTLYAGPNGVKPKHLICDHGVQFFCGPFKAWCKLRGIKPRYGAVGRYGSLAVIERLIRTLKDGFTRRILVPFRREAVRQEVATFVAWYNECRPNMTLKGRTPNEVYFSRRPANERSRIEPRARWPAASRCASPQAPVDGPPGRRVELVVRHRHGLMPIVELRPAA
jgi:transposase InsO family protein